MACGAAFASAGANPWSPYITFRLAKAGTLVAYVLQMQGQRSRILVAQNLENRQKPHQTDSNQWMVLQAR